jgi:hypothetical protein
MIIDSIINSCQMCFSKRTGGKPLISDTASTYLLRTYDLILDFLLSQHKTNLNHDVFGTNTFLVVIGVM